MIKISFFIGENVFGESNVGYFGFLNSFKAVFEKSLRSGDEEWYLELDK
jgi:hypothetical protein